jgi:SAM-dependent methyltransferase
MITTFHYITIVIIILAIVVFLVFNFVIIFGAPFLPTLKRQVPKAVELLDLKPGQTLIELGSGDGRVLIYAAQAGLYVVGFELNPILALYSWLRTRKYGKKVKIIWGNYWKKEWPDADGIFVFLLDPYMEKLNKKIIQRYKKKVRLVSFAFKIPSRKHDEEFHGMYLYKYNYKNAK